MTRACAACTHLHQRCNSNCALAPYFPADKPDRFKAVNTVFGKSNVSKLLRELDISEREEAANSLVYEAEARMRDPVHGCVGLIEFLQRRLKEVEEELRSKNNELANIKLGSRPDDNQNPLGNHGDLLSNNIGGESQQRPIVVTAAEQQRNLEQLRQMGGTSTGGYQIEQPPHQQE